MIPYAGLITASGLVTAGVELVVVREEVALSLDHLDVGLEHRAGGNILQLVRFSRGVERLPIDVVERLARIRL